MAAKVEGVEGPASPPQGVDGGRSRTRHTRVMQSMCGSKEANPSHDTHWNTQQKRAKLRHELLLWLQQKLLTILRSFSRNDKWSIQIRFICLFQRNTIKWELSVGLKSNVVVSFCFCTNIEQRLSESSSTLPWSLSLLHSTVVFNALSVLSLLLVATNPVALSLSLSLCLSSSFQSIW